MCSKLCNFTQSSTPTDDLSEMDLKLKLLNRIHLNKLIETHTTHQQLYDTLYESIILDQDALDAQAAQSSFHKSSHDNQDPPNNHKEENKKKHLEGAGLERLKRKEVRRYHFEALNGIHHWEENIIDFFKEGMSTVTKGNSGAPMIKSMNSATDLPRLNVNDVEDMYLLQVEDMLHHLPLEVVKDFNNALLMFIRRIVIKNRVEDIHLGVESYQRTLNLTKPTMFFKGIDQRIPFTMTTTHKMLKKIDEILRHREQLRRLEEMDNPNITMEEYIRLEEEKSIETEFPAISFSNQISSEKTLSCERMLSSLNDEVDFKISFDDFNDEDYTVIFDKNLFSYKIISTNDLKKNSENDNEKVNMPSLSPPEPTVSYFDDLDFVKDSENEFPAIVYNDAPTSKLD
ncbi:hypothetical protein Tco_1410867 [Tanacetum coccineum]